MKKGSRDVMKTNPKWRTWGKGGPILCLVWVALALGPGCAEQGKEPSSDSLEASKVSRCVTSIPGYRVLEERKILATQAFRRVETRNGSRPLSALEGRVLSLGQDESEFRFANLRVERSETSFFEMNGKVLREAAIFSAHVVTERTVRGLPILEWEPKGESGAVVSEALLLDSENSTSVSVQFFRADGPAGQKGASQDRKVLREKFLTDLATCLAL